MPSYLFHLFFDLHAPTAPIARSLPELVDFSEAQLSSLPVWIPPPGTNIFTTTLPSHPPSLASRGKGVPLQQLDSENKVRNVPPQKDPQSEAKILPPEQKDPKNKAKETQSTDSPTCQYLDWRFGKIGIESIDMDSISTPVLETSAQGKKPSTTASLPGGSAAKAYFIPIESKNTEFGYGVVHLYRDVYETPGLYNPKQDPVRGEGAEVESEDALTTVAILAVPSYMTPSDFMGFVGEETRDTVSHFRMIRTGKANRYLVLMKFRQKEDAKAFVTEFNGKVFNSMEPENCHVVFIKSIQFQKPSSNNQNSSVAFPEISNDPFFPSQGPRPAVSASSSAVPVNHISTKPVPPPTPSLLELPTCPVCLERMDETTGLLTILCQHVFHCACLSKWKDSSCPVCRYTQGPGIRERNEDSEDEDECCGTCGAVNNLWICLICGNVGCGRYDDAHAFEHYKETSHCYAMDIETQRVWDYAGDGYVHRLIQNKADGKLVELPSALSHSHDPDHPGSGDYVPREKLDNIGMEYTYLLTSQLDSQRQYFEEKVAQAADKATSAAHAAEKAVQESREVMKELQTLRARHDEVVTELLPAVERGKERAERKAEKLGEMARRMEKEWREEKGVSGGLMERIEFLTKEAEERKKQNEDLNEQIRDLMFFLEAREKMKGEEEEIVEGTVTVGDAPPVQSGRKRKGKGRR